MDIRTCPVWMHDLTPIPELRRFYGEFIDEEIRNELPGMEARNVRKYAAGQDC
jgi:hypothetical protein